MGRFLRSRRAPRDGTGTFGWHWVVGAVVIGAATLSGAPSAYAAVLHPTVNGNYIPIVGDFDGNGVDDITWYAPGTIADSTWFYGPGGTHTTRGTSIIGTYFPVVGDFNGDAFDDILWYAPGTAADFLWTYGAGGTHVSRATGISGRYVPVAGNFNGDAFDDILWYAPGTGGDYLWTYGPGGSHTSRSTSINGTYTPVVGDFTGNGYDDVLWYAPGTGADYLWTYSAGGAHSSYPRSINGAYRPVVGDYNGDARDDIMLHAPGLPTDYLWTATSAGNFSSKPGSVLGTTYRPFAGDFNGNGTSDLFWYAPGTGVDSIWTDVPADFAPLAACALLLTGCYADTLPPREVGSTSARLMAKGYPACHPGGVGRFEYSTSLATLEAGSGTVAGSINFPAMSTSCGATPTKYEFEARAAGLAANSTYQYRVCGQYDGVTAWSCSNVTTFTTLPTPADFVGMQGSSFTLNGVPFHPYGGNHEAFGVNGTSTYLETPSKGLEAIRQDFTEVRAMGFNAARLHLELFHFVQRDAAGKVSIRPATLTAYTNLLALAQEFGLKLDVTGNLVWLPGSAPAWYDAMSNQARWEVQMLFWRELARVGASSPAIMSYELTSEPVISADPNPPWYGGLFGGYNFVQVIAKGVPEASQVGVVRDWVSHLSGAIRTYDRHHLITVGQLPISDGPFAAKNLASNLDFITVHMYPSGKDGDAASIAADRAMLDSFNLTGKPLLLGENSWFTGGLETNEAILRYPGIDGVFSFYDGRTIEEAKAVGDIKSAIYWLNLEQFLALRDVLQS